ncbi:MAG: lipopolysaccharide heptosyltransferase II [Candidatus Eiseniibacteriota bacterium]
MSRSLAFRAPNWLGDAVLATVVLPAIRRRDPAARVTVLAPPGLGDLFSRSAYVDETRELVPGGEVDAYRTGGYDLVLLGPTSFGSAWRAVRGGAKAFGFATSGRGVLLSGRLAGAQYRRGRHQVENYRALAALVGEPAPADAPAVTIDPEWAREARERWPVRTALRVVLQPGAAYGPAKRWPAERFGETGAALLAEGHDVAVIGSAADRQAVERVRERAPGVVDLSGSTRIGVLAALLESASLLITNDTGPMHLAAAAGTRCLAVFGSTSPEWTRPLGTGHEVVRRPVACAPCFLRRCPIGTPCLEGIDAAAVLARARASLAEAA